MEDKVRQAHALAIELAREVDGSNWYGVYNNVFHAMLAGTFANPLLDAKSDEQIERERRPHSRLD